jgi:hypothetical protein
MTDKATPEWKDVTSYSRDDRERVPNAFAAQSGPVRLVVTCKHRDCPGEWIMHGYGLGIDTEPLGLSAEEPAGKAMAEAERVALMRVGRLERGVLAIFNAREGRGDD